MDSNRSWEIFVEVMMIVAGISSTITLALIVRERLLDIWYRIMDWWNDLAGWRR